MLTAQKAHLKERSNTADVKIKSGSTSEQSCGSRSETESDSVEGLSLEDSSRLIILYKKHLLITSLMQELYALFDQRWSLAFRSHGNTSADKSTPRDIDGSFLSGDVQCTRKRRRNERDSTPPEDHDDKKGSRRKLSLAGENSSHYEYQGLETYTGKSPRSQNLEDFETYSRTELPRLVEANLQVMVNAQIAPLEESLKAMLVDLVRRCQSTVAQNYGRINPITTADGGAEHPKARTTPSVEQTTTTPTKVTLSQLADGQSTTNPPQHDGPYFFEEPPLLTANEADAIAALFPSLPHNDAFDSGYGSQRACCCVFESDITQDCKLSCDSKWFNEYNELYRLR
ncbi:MAG: hypothetical protein Q9180_004626 [Flavoplaca navasiana]